MEEELPSSAMALVQKNLLSKQIALDYYQTARKQNVSFIDFLVNSSVIDPRKIAFVFSDYFNLQFVDLDEYSISQDIIQLIPLDLIISYKILPLYLHKSELVIAIDDPSNYSVTRDVKFYCEYSLVFVVVETNKLNEKLHNFLYKKQYSLNDNLRTSEHSKKVDLGKEDPVVKLVNMVINSAVTKGASDVHIEPFDDCYRIRYRIDGLLHHISKIDNGLAFRVCSRIKILSNLNIVEHRLPQDGRFSFLLESQKMIDCRVSICPTVSHEKIVIRFLNKVNTENLTISSLRMEKRDEKAFINALNCPQGLILVTGPTGSGKSTTLYTALNYLNKDEINLITVEDPVEMNIHGVNQIQVNVKSGLNFATILRAILRQDPDIIMIGEIRDLETATIAIQAAETGHLVLASLHTNSAAQTISRLINLGIPIYNLLNSLRLIVAQRLVRKLCTFCYAQNRSLRKLADESVLRDDAECETAVYSSVHEDSSTVSTKPDASLVEFPKRSNIKDLSHGCIKCHAGYHGRIGIFEIMSVSNILIKNLILKDFNINEFEKLACKEGMQLIKNAGLNLVKMGVTSLEEVRRVVEI